jgi:hypothetical protein
MSIPFKAPPTAPHTKTIVYDGVRAPDGVTQ